MQQALNYIRFKNDDPLLMEQWLSGNLHPGTVVVVLYAARFFFLLTGRPAVITSIYRKKTTDSGVHENWCAVDLRCTDMSEEQRESWGWAIKHAFPYDYSSSPTAETALIHEVRGEDGKSRGLHLHVQTGPLEPRPKQDKPKNSIV